MTTQTFWACIWVYICFSIGFRLVGRFALRYVHHLFKDRINKYTEWEQLSCDSEPLVVKSFICFTCGKSFEVSVCHAINSPYITDCALHKNIKECKRMGRLYRY